MDDPNVVAAGIKRVLSNDEVQDMTRAKGLLDQLRKGKMSIADAVNVRAELRNIYAKYRAGDATDKDIEQATQAMLDRALFVANDNTPPELLDLPNVPKRPVRPLPSELSKYSMSAEATEALQDYLYGPRNGAAPLDTDKMADGMQRALRIFLDRNAGAQAMDEDPQNMQLVVGGLPPPAAAAQAMDEDPEVIDVAAQTVMVGAARQAAREVERQAMEENARQAAAADEARRQVMVGAAQAAADEIQRQVMVGAAQAAADDVQRQVIINGRAQAERIVQRIQGQRRAQSLAQMYQNQELQRAVREAQVAAGRALAEQTAARFQQEAIDQAVQGAQIAAGRARAQQTAARFRQDAINQAVQGAQIAAGRARAQQTAARLQREAVDQAIREAAQQLPGQLTDEEIDNLVESIAARDEEIDRFVDDLANQIG
jgi:hypothetical protein